MRSPQATLRIIAAIALILNWTLPASLQLNGVFSLSDAAPGISSEARGLQPGTLPRALPQEVRCETGTPKPQHKVCSAGGKPPALVPDIVTATVALHASATLGASHDRLVVAALRSFDARAPPPLTA